MTTESIARQRFLLEYRHIRHAEGRGSDSSEYYRALPLCSPTDPNAAMWAMRAKTYFYFEKHILKDLERTARRPLNVLDLGAGNGWLSNRLTQRGHEAVALDIFADEKDGLGAVRHYSPTFPVVESDFDALPFPTKHFDLVIFNASIHYSVNYFRTLAEVRRCLRPNGRLVILDSPIYRLREHGRRMVEEKHSAFQKRYGFRSDALPSMEFLDLPMLRILQASLTIDWKIYKPWYGWAWHLRPLKAFLLRRRPPSRFWILAGRFETA